MDYLILFVVHAEWVTTHKHKYIHMCMYMYLFTNVLYVISETIFNVLKLYHSLYIRHFQFLWVFSERRGAHDAPGVHCHFYILVYICVYVCMTLFVHSSRINLNERYL